MDVIKDLISKYGLDFTNIDSILASLELFLSNPDNLILLAYIVGGAFIFLLLLGITDTVIVYKNVSDFLWSLALIIVPVSTFFILAFLVPEDAPETYNIYWEATQQRIISVMGGFFTVIALFKTFINCIVNNGILFGPVMFLFKLCAAVVCVLIVLGVANKLFEKNRSLKTVIVTMIVFGVFSFFVKRLINCDRIMIKSV